MARKVLTLLLVYVVAQIGIGSSVASAAATTDAPICSFDELEEFCDQATEYAREVVRGCGVAGGGVNDPIGKAQCVYAKSQPLLCMVPVIDCPPGPMRRDRLDQGRF